MEIGTIIAAIEAAIAAAPKVIAAAAAARDFVAGLFGAGAIDKATQDALFNHIEGLAKAVLTGGPSPAWTVEKDPGK